MRRLLTLVLSCGVIVGVFSACTADEAQDAREVTQEVEEPTPETISTRATTSVVSSGTTERTTTTRATANEAEQRAAVRFVEGFYEALNTGDLSVLEALGPAPLAEQSAHRLAIAVEGVGARFEVSCRAGVPPGQVVCSETVQDDLYGPAHIVHKHTIRYLVTDQELEVVGPAAPFGCSTDLEGMAQEFLLDFHEWSVATHVESAQHWEWGLDDTATSIPCTPYPFHSVDGAREICSQLDEFLEQSDEWPPRALVAWDERSTRIEQLAGDALIQVGLIEAAMDELPNDALGEEGWFESCCTAPRDELTAIFSEIAAELDELELLLPDLESHRVDEAMRYLRIAQEGASYGQSLLETEIEVAGRGAYPRSARSMVSDGLPTIINHTILGCLRACGVD